MKASPAPGQVWVYTFEGVAVEYYVLLSQVRVSPLVAPRRDLWQVCITDAQTGGSCHSEIYVDELPLLGGYERVL